VFPVNGLLADLADIAGKDHVLTDPGITGGYTTDWTRRYSGLARCVVRPGSAEEVVAVVVACARHGVPIVPQGGNTGQVTAGAGVTISDLREHAARAGLEYGVNLASRESATVGGTIATNAGGVQAIRYGGTRAQVLGVEAVLAKGSEGTLGVVTAARLRLWPAEPPVITLLAGVGGIAEAAALQAVIRAAVPGIRAIEYLEAPGLALVREHTGLPAPLPENYPAYLLAEVAGAPENAEDYAERLLVAPQLGSASVAVDAAGREALWAYRERHTESISAAGIPHKLDVAMSLSRLPGFRGVGNVHVNVLGPGPEDQAVDEVVLGLAAAYGGTISAEHGIGHTKAALLHLSRTPAEIAAMRAVKSALDPAGILNPGVLLAGGVQ
jgi:FAD/FMN-containing dehydrogenase